VRFTAKLLEEKIVTRIAMKAPPAKSALDGAVNVTKTVEVANEILNEMRRDALGITALEDVSRYQVTVRIPGGGSFLSPPFLNPVGRGLFIEPSAPTTFSFCFSAPKV